MGRAKLGYTRVGRVGYVYNQVWKEEKKRSPVAVWEGSFVTKANWRQVDDDDDDEECGRRTARKRTGPENEFNRAF